MSGMMKQVKNIKMFFFLDFDIFAFQFKTIYEYRCNYVIGNISKEMSDTVRKWGDFVIYGVVLDVIMMNSNNCFEFDIVFGSVIFPNVYNFMRNC